MNEFQFEKLIREAAHKEKTNIPEDFNNMLKCYPEVDEILRQEYRRFSEKDKIGEKV